MLAKWWAGCLQDIGFGFFPHIFYEDLIGGVLLRRLCFQQVLVLVVLGFWSSPWPRTFSKLEKWLNTFALICTTTDIFNAGRQRFTWLYVYSGMKCELWDLTPLCLSKLSCQPPKKFKKYILQSLHMLYLHVHQKTQIEMISLSPLSHIHKHTKINQKSWQWVRFGQGSRQQTGISLQAMAEWNRQSDASKRNWRRFCCGGCLFCLVLTSSLAYIDLCCLST